ncbi:MAG: hypothetical protein LBT64_03625 [Puniceicoccales bacterium]|jgi:hypothetical protein|nr:hypothetical protein [Puniceicoccales bacterium]
MNIDNVDPITTGKEIYVPTPYGIPEEELQTVTGGEQKSTVSTAKGEYNVSPGGARESLTDSRAIGGICGHVRGLKLKHVSGNVGSSSGAGVKDDIHASGKHHRLLHEKIKVISGGQEVLWSSLTLEQQCKLLSDVYHGKDLGEKIEIIRQFQLHSKTLKKFHKLYQSLVKILSDAGILSTKFILHKRTHPHLHHSVKYEHHNWKHRVGGHSSKIDATGEKGRCAHIRHRKCAEETHSAGNPKDAKGTSTGKDPAHKPRPHGAIGHHGHGGRRAKG